MNKTLSDDDIRAIIDGLDGVPAGPWSAHMDDFTLHVDHSYFIPDNYTLALCATGDHAYKLTPHLARCGPDTIRALTERALRSPVHADGGVKVKAHVWQKENVDGTFWTGVAQSSGQYDVRHAAKGWEAGRGMTRIGWFDTCDEAKAACYADFNTRILAAIESGKGETK